MKCREDWLNGRQSIGVRGVRKATLSAIAFRRQRRATRPSMTAHMRSRPGSRRKPVDRHALRHPGLGLARGACESPCGCVRRARGEPLMLRWRSIMAITSAPMGAPGRGPRPNLAGALSSERRRQATNCGCGKEYFLSTAACPLPGTWCAGHLRPLPLPSAMLADNVAIQLK